MPLVTRTSANGNIFNQPAEPTTWLNGDLWSENDTALLFINDNGTAVQI